LTFNVNYDIIITVKRRYTQNAESRNDGALDTETKHFEGD